jgi:hypothetical protein
MWGAGSCQCVQKTGNGARERRTLRFPVVSPLSVSESEMFASTRSSRSEEEMRRAHRARHVGTRVLCTVLPPRARRSRSQIDNRILPRKIKETVLRSAPVSGKSLGPLLPHPSVDSLHRLVTSQMSPCTMGTNPAQESLRRALPRSPPPQRQRQANRATETRPHRRAVLHRFIPHARLRVGIDEVPRQTGPGELSTLVSAGTAHETAQERTARAGVGDRQHARL